MSSVKNKGASVLQKLKNKAKQDKVSVLTLADQYAFTAFLRRLSNSRWNDFFALKGGLMMLVITGDNLRPTYDVDLDGKQSMTLEELKDALRAIASIELPEDDGVVFDVDSINPQKDRTQGLISGAKIGMVAKIGTHRVNVKLDVAYENVITPSVSPIQMPLQLQDEAPVNIMMYPVESSISEKFRAMLYYGKSNSRLKDFYDIQAFSKMCALDSEDLARAIVGSANVFELKVPPTSEIEAFQPENASLFEAQWSAFLRKNKIEASDFGSCISDIKAFLEPVIDYINEVAPSPGKWDPEAGWSNSFDPEHESRMNFNTL